MSGEDNHCLHPLPNEERARAQILPGVRPAFGHDEGWCFHQVSIPESYTPKYLAERIRTSGLENERKLVTVLFADIKSSTEMIADRDPEDASRILDAVLQHMIEAVHRFEGTVSRVMGDGIMALFGAPVALEIHAVRGCYAALLMQETIKRFSEEIRHTEGLSIQVRIGVNSGEVIVRSISSDLHMDYTAMGQKQPTWPRAWSRWRHQAPS